MNYRCLFVVTLCAFSSQKIQSIPSAHENSAVIEFDTIKAQLHDDLSKAHQKALQWAQQCSDHEKAIELMNYVLTLCEKSTSSDAPLVQADCHLELSRIYKLLNQPEEAQRHYTTAHTVVEKFDHAHPVIAFLSVCGGLFRA